MWGDNLSKLNRKLRRNQTASSGWMAELRNEDDILNSQHTNTGKATTSQESEREEITIPENKDSNFKDPPFHRIYTNTNTGRIKKASTFRTKPVPDSSTSIQVESPSLNNDLIEDNIQGLNYDDGVKLTKQLTKMLTVLTDKDSFREFEEGQSKSFSRNTTKNLQNHIFLSKETLNKKKSNENSLSDVDNPLDKTPENEFEFERQINKIKQQDSVFLNKKKEKAQEFYSQNISSKDSNNGKKPFLLLRGKTLRTARMIKKDDDFIAILSKNSMKLLQCNIILIVLGIFDSEFRWTDSSNYTDFGVILTLNIMRGLQTFIMMISLRYLLKWYNAYIHQLHKKFLIIKEGSWGWKLKFCIILEIFITLLHIFPFIDYGCEDFNEGRYVDIITFLMFGKLYIILRVMRDSSPLNTHSGRFIGSFTKIEYTDKFLIKSWLKAHPTLTLSSTIFFLIFICSYLIYLSEREFPVACTIEEEGFDIENISGKFSNFFNVLWFLIVTIMTVGYGDMSASTVVGRLLSIFVAFMGLVFSATLIGIVHDYLVLNNDEYTVVKFIEDNERIRLYEISALQCIKDGVKYYIKKFQLASPSQIKKARAKLGSSINKFRILRNKKYGQMSFSTNALSMIEYQIEMSQNRIETLIDYLKTKNILLLDDTKENENYLTQLGSLLTQSLVTPKKEQYTQTELIIPQKASQEEQNSPQIQKIKQQSSNFSNFKLTYNKEIQTSKYLQKDAVIQTIPLLSNRESFRTQILQNSNIVSTTSPVTEISFNAGYKKYEIEEETGSQGEITISREEYDKIQHKIFSHESNLRNIEREVQEFQRTVLNQHRLYEEYLVQLNEEIEKANNNYRNVFSLLQFQNSNNQQNDS